MTDGPGLVERSRTPLAVAYVLTFIAFVDTFALLPTMGPYAALLGATGLGMGLAVGAYSITDIMFNVVGGVMLDRAGRRRLAIIGFAIVTVAMLLYPLATSVSTLIGIRLLHGVGGGIMIPAVYTLIGDLSRAGAKGRAMGRVGALIGTVAVVAPGLAGATRARAGFDAVFFGLAALMAIGLIIVLVKVRETLDEPDRAQARTVSIKSLLAIKSLRVACVSVFGFTVGFGSLSAFLPSQLEDRGYSAAVSGGLFTLLALVAVVIMLTRVSARVDVLGPRKPVLLGLPLILTSLLILGNFEQIGVISLAMVLFGLGFGVVYPAVSGATASAASAPGRGRAFGIFSVFYSMGFVIGPPLAGLLRDRVGLSPFLTAAVFSVAAILVVSLMSDDSGMPTSAEQSSSSELPT
jgi:MFS transporter, DHA1 family, multidrug resistance protein